MSLAAQAVYNIVGGELIYPRKMGERLREIRSAVAAESKRTVMDLVAPELRQARLKYTDYVEEDDDGLGTYERFKLAAEEDGEKGKNSLRTFCASLISSHAHRTQRVTRTEKLLLRWAWVERWSLQRVFSIY